MRGVPSIGRVPRIGRVNLLKDSRGVPYSFNGGTGRRAECPS